MNTLPKLDESLNYVVGDKHPAGCSPRDDKITKMSSFALCVMANGY